VNFDETGYQLRLIPQQPFTSCVKKHRPQHYLTRNNNCHIMFRHLTWKCYQRTRYIRDCIMFKMLPLYMDTRPGLHHLQPSITACCVPQSDVALVVLLNVSRINSSSTTCREFFHQFLSAITLKLIQIFLCHHLHADPFLECRLLHKLVHCFIKTHKLQMWTLDALCRFSIQKIY